MSDETAASLLRLGPDAFVRETALENERTRQELGYHRLTKRMKNAAGIPLFLLEYDACMRLAELLALRFGLRFGVNPHQAFKLILASQIPHLDRGLTKDLVAARHLAKKWHEQPDHRVMNHLLQIHEQLKLRIHLG